MSEIVNNPIVVMKRYELKYLLSAEQTAFFREKLKGHMEADHYGKTSIASLYYDTPTYQLVRSSIEKPEFKEKIRLRSYGLATQDSSVYLELKRKAFDVVYKRRVRTTIPSVERFFAGESEVFATPARLEEPAMSFADRQINREITTFRDHYQTLVPACLIIYDRIAYYEQGGDLRLTIDENPRYRVTDLRLDKSMEGISLLPEGWTIMEIKVQDAMPLWLTHLLDEGKIRKGSFSKYGEAYRQQLVKVSKTAS